MSTEWRLSVLTQAMMDLLSGVGTLRGSHYGDPPVAAPMPCVGVEAEGVAKEIARVSRPPRTENTIQLQVYIYFSKLGKGELGNKQCDELLEAVVSAMEADPTLGGKVIYGHPTQLRSAGAAIRGNTLVKIAQVTWTARSLSTIGS